MSRTSAPPTLSILIAAFNEQASIEACLREVARVYTRDVEVLVIDGGHDRTGEHVRALQRSMAALRYVRNDPDLGKGHAIRRGIAEARGTLMAQLDADLQFLRSDLPRLVEPLQRGAADVVLGSRFARGARRLPGGTPLARTLGNRFMSGYASVLCARRMTDVLAGIEAWTRAAIESIYLRSDGYSYEVEIPMRAIRRGVRVIEVPVTTQARHGGESNVDVVRVGARMLVDIGRFHYFNLRSELTLKIADLARDAAAISRRVSAARVVSIAGVRSSAREASRLVAHGDESVGGAVALSVAFALAHAGISSRSSYAGGHIESRV